MSTLLADRTLTFLESAFDARSLAAEYPLVFDERFDGETLEIVEEGEVRAACTILVREFRCGSRTLRGGLIGSVATDPRWRRRGLASRLLVQAEERLRQRECLFALLWADDPAFYLKRGYEPFACEYDALLVSELREVLPEPSGVREFRAGDEPLLHHLHARHSTRVERTLEETRALFTVPGMLTLVRERAGAAAHPVQPVAYACLGRGRDLSDTVHDWAGEAEDVLALLAAHLDRRFPARESGALLFLVPPSEIDLGYRLTTLGALLRPGILGLGKILAPARAAQHLDAILRSGRSAGAASWNGSTLELEGPKGHTQLDVDGMNALLFGGPDVRGAIDSLLERLGLGRVRLPLEPFAFGLDSI